MQRALSSVLENLAIAAELQNYTFAVTAVQNRYLSLSEVASGEERFNLYWTLQPIGGHVAAG